MPELPGPARAVPGFAASGNALVLWRRCLPTSATVGAAPAPEDHLPQRRWAVMANLGQTAELVAAAAARRLAAAGAATLPGERAVSVELTVTCAVLVGAAEKGAQDIGLALHGTYGWPVIRGSSLKGVARAYAAETGAAAREIDTVFGVPGSDDAPEDGLGAGRVRFCDALPDGRPVTVAEDVLTPHAQEYYRSDGATAPTETNNPIPVPFLAVTGGAWRTILIGQPTALILAVKWLKGAVDELGVGAKTAAGYGYLCATPEAVR